MIVAKFVPNEIRISVPNELGIGGVQIVDSHFGRQRLDMHQSSTSIKEGIKIMGLVQIRI